MVTEVLTENLLQSELAQKLVELVCWSQTLLTLLCVLLNTLSNFGFIAAFFCSFLFQMELHSVGSHVLCLPSVFGQCQAMTED